MNITIRRAAFVVTLSLIAALPIRSFAQGEPPAPSPAPSVHSEMEAMGHALRQISRQYTDASQKTSTLALVDEVLKHAQTARGLTPPQVQKLTGDAQTQKLDTFQKDLDGVIKEIGNLKTAVAADKPDDMKAELEKLGQLKQAGHKDLGVGEGHGHGHGGPPPPAQ